jgi:hypothetical protein
MGIDQGKARVTGRKGQVRLTQVNVWIKVIIIIILKLNLKFDLRQDSGHESGESTWFTHIFLYKKNQSKPYFDQKQITK